MILDIRFNSVINSEVSFIFNKISYEHRGDFNDLVAEISLPYVDNIDWWVQGPASRNTFSSSLFHNYCCVYLLRYLIEEKIFVYKEVLVDSEALRILFQNFLVAFGMSDCVVSIRVSFKKYVRNIVKRNFSIYGIFIRKIYQLFIARITNRIAIKSTSLLLLQPIVLIDTFVMPGYNKEDRWYGSLWGNLTKGQQAETFFVPTIVRTSLKDMYRVYKNTRKNARNYLIKEDLLTLSDLFYACSYKRRIKKIKIKPVFVLEYEFSDVIQEEFDNNPDMLTVVESLLTYRFVENLKIKGVRPRLAIDWFEGQVIDKAWNMGFKHFFPEVKTIGYRAFESFPFYLCSYPLTIEKKAGVIPKVMAIQGKGTLETVNEFMTDLDTILIPSFKSQYVWESEIDFNKKKCYTVLVTLPIAQSSALRISKRVCQICEKLNIKTRGVKFIVKPHPTHSSTKIQEKLNFTLPDNLSFSSERSFSRLLNKSQLLITEASSTCLEAMACGLSVIMMENEEGLTFDPIPKRIHGEIYKKTRTQEQLLKAVEYYTNLNPGELAVLRAESEVIREDYFEPITQAGIDRFMNLDV